MTEETDRPSIAEALREAIQAVYNKYPMDGYGAALAGDFLLLTEVHTQDRTVLRIVSNDEMTPWKRTGLLQWLVNDDTAEAAAGYAIHANHGDDEDDGPT